VIGVFIERMPNQRADNQTLIAFALNRKLLAALDRACTQSGEDRSTFIRQALVNVIRERQGVVQDEWVRAQARARGAHRYEPVGEPAPVKTKVPKATAKGKASIPAKK